MVGGLCYGHCVDRWFVLWMLCRHVVSVTEVLWTCGLCDGGCTDRCFMSLRLCGQVIVVTVVCCKWIIFDRYVIRIFSYYILD